MLAEIKETRRELARLNADMARVASGGQQAGRNFGQKFRRAAISGVKAMAEGAMHEVGQRLAGRMMDRGQKSGRSYGRGFKRGAKREIDTLSKNPGASGMRMNVGALPIVGAGLLAAGIAAQVGKSLKLAFEQERLEISFTALSSDGQGGSRIFEDLRADALRTGQDIASMAGSVQRFLGLGFDEAKALQLNDALLDIAGALGMTNYEAAGLGSALAQVQAKGVASMEELRQQIAEKGVPVFQVLAEKMGMTEAAVIDLVSKGKVGADTVIDAFVGMEGPLERFRGGADRAANTTGGLFQRMLRHLDDLKMRFAEGLLPELAIALSDGVGFMEELKQAAIDFGARMGNAFGFIRAAIKGLSLKELFELAALQFQKSMNDALMALQRAISATFGLLSGDDFSRGMERAALTFKSIMMATVAEIARGLAEMMPDTMRGRKAALMLGAAGNQMEVRANIALADRDRIEAPDPVSMARQWKKDYDAAGGISFMSAEQQADLEELKIIIARQRAADQKAREESVAATAAPAGGRSTGGTPTAAAPSAGGLVAGGLANAISRISGGPSTVLMTRQLDALTGIQRSAAASAASTERVATEVAGLRREIAVFS